MAKVVLYVMTQKGFEVLQRLISSNKDAISSVVIGRDANVENDFSTDIETLCQNASIPYHFRGSDPGTRPEDYVLTVSWRWMVDHPNDRLIIFHDSLLPKYRGFAPLVNMLINGETKIGVSAIFGAQNYDEGDLIATRSTDITYPLKIADAIQINNENYLQLAEEIVGKLGASEELSATPQSTAQATYSIWRDAEDYLIDWTQSASRIKRFIDAVGPPYAGARSQTSDGNEIIIDDSEVVEDVNCELRHCGKVIFIKDGYPTVICAEGLLRITKARLVTKDGTENYLPVKAFRTRFK